MIGKAFYAVVHSDYAESGHTGDFIYKIRLPIEHTYDSVAFLQGTFPKSYYVVREGLNSFMLSEISGIVTITIPAGNYSMVSFKEVLKNELNAKSPGKYTYSVTIPPSNNSADTGKYTYTVSGNNDDQPIFSFPMNSLLYKQMGFNNYSINTFANNTLISQNVCDFIGVSGLYLISDCIDGENIQASIGTNILQEILFDDTPNLENIKFINPNPFITAKKLKNHFGPLFNFKLVDTNNKIIDFNGLNCSFSLCFFRREDLNDLKTKHLENN
jgi:hypothetical protein